MIDLVQRAELGSFLRARREATDPGSVGFEPGPRRRTPGLRREELAQLAGLSVTWYTWLEQGRDITVSRQVIQSLVLVLRLSAPERGHLYTLSGLVPPPERAEPHPIDGTLVRLVRELHPKPAYVMNQWWDLLVYNDAYAGLLGGLDQRPAAERNILWLTFTESRGAGLFVDWDGEARSLVGQLRVALARHPDDRRGVCLLRSLLAVDVKFRELWEEHTVSGFAAKHKRLCHPMVGRFDVDYVKLAGAEGAHESLVVFLPSDDESAAKIGQLR
jgi:transcriptional regulator with XRE-family HTH domain